MPPKKKPLSPMRQRAFAAVDTFRGIVVEKGWTHEEASDESGFGLTTVGRWLRGNHAPTSRAMIEALEKFNRRHQPKKEE